MFRAIIACLIFAVLAVAGCDSAHQDDPPKALIEVPGGIDLSLEERKSTWEMFYQVSVPYPAEGALKHIKKELSKSGWRPLTEDFLNPGTLSSHVTGWDTFLDATTSPRSRVHQWLGQWLHDDGSVVWYTLQYRYNERVSPELDNLAVSGIYIPGDVASTILEELPSNPLTSSSSGSADELR